MTLQERVLALAFAFDSRDSRRDDVFRLAEDVGRMEHERALVMMESPGTTYAEAVERARERLRAELERVPMRVEVKL